MKVALFNRRTGVIVQQKIGWSWPCCLFGWAWGIPLFYKKLYGLGTFILMIEWISYGIAQPNSELRESPITTIVLIFLPFVISVLLAGFVNKLSGRKYLRNGWEFFAPDAEATKVAIQRWGIIPASVDATLVKRNRVSSVVRKISIIGLSVLCSFVLVLFIIVIGEKGLCLCFR